MLTVNDRDILRLALAALKRGRPQIQGILVQEDQDEAIAVIENRLSNPENPTALSQIQRKAIDDAISTICSAKLCTINAMSSLPEVRRHMQTAINKLRTLL